MYSNYLPVIPGEPLYYVKADLDYPKTFCFIFTDVVVFIFESLFLLFIYSLFFYLFLYLSHCICVVLFYLLSNSKTTTTKYNCCVTRYWWQQQSSTNENDEEIFPSFIFPTCCYRFSQDFFFTIFFVLIFHNTKIKLRKYKFNTDSEGI